MVVHKNILANLHDFQCSQVRTLHPGYLLHLTNCHQFFQLSVEGIWVDAFGWRMLDCSSAIVPSIIGYYFNPLEIVSLHHHRLLSVLFSLGFILFMEPFLKKTSTVELRPYQISNSWYLHHSPPIPLPDQTFEQLWVISILDIHVEIANIRRYLDIDAMQQA